MTRGALSWHGLAEAISGGPDDTQPVGKYALRQYVMATKSFQYTATRTLPQCNNELPCKWRKHWVFGFCFFWEGEKLIKKGCRFYMFALTRSGSSSLLFGCM